MPWIGPAIGAGVGLIGDFMSQSGQQSTNQMAATIAAQNNATAIDLAKNAMTYRVEDLKRAGLNPMLAAGGPGMSVPTLQQPSLQNPGAAFGQAGNQVSNAMQLSTISSQIDANKASAARDTAAANKTQAEEAAVRSTLPYTGATAQAALDNLRRTNDNLFYSAQNLERDWSLSQRSLSQLLENPTFASQFQALKQMAAQVDLERSRLGLPRLENDASWQKAHPELSGWMQSGVPQGALDAIGTGAKVISSVTPGANITKNIYQSFGRR